MNSTPCRFCSAPLGHVFVDLGMQPMANAYVEATAVDAAETFYPLTSFVCESCFLVQLPEVVRPAEIFSDYSYFSSYSDTWLKHAEGYVEAMVARFGFDAHSQVVEIASNDGYLLQYFKRRGVPVLGIEPARNVAEVAVKAGIPTRVAFFGAATARDLGVQADLLLGNNVLAHVPELNDFVRGLKLALKPRGVITMEFPHLERLMAENQFDTIYHEHYSYFSFTVVNRVFAAAGLRLFDVEELTTHGGSLRIFGRHVEDGAKAVGKRVADLLAREDAAGFAALATYDGFAERVRETKRKLLEFLIAARRQGKRVVGYGAPAKGNTLLNYCGVRTDFLDYTVDRSPHKQGRFLPGTHIPIHGPDKVRETKPDYLLILPWNIRDEVMEQMADVRSWGCRFVVAIPEVRVLA